MQRLSQGCRRAVRASSSVVEDVLRFWGSVVAHYPVLIVVVSSLVCIAASAGFVNTRIETSIEKLWLPQSSRIQENEARYGKYFDLTAGAFRVLAQSQRASSNSLIPDRAGMLTPERVASLFKIRDGMYSDIVASDGSTVTDICVPGSSQHSNSSNGCSESGITTLWCSFESFIADVLEADAPHDRLSQRVTDAVRCDNTSAPFAETCALPAFDTLDATGTRRVVGCEAIKLDVLVAGGESNALYGAFDKYMQNNIGKFDSGVKAAYFYPSIVTDAVSQQIQSGYHLWALAYTLVFLLLSASQWRRDKRESRPLLSLLGVVTVLLANVGAYGVLIAANMPIANLQLLLPYLIVALGVDDVLILMESMRQSRHIQPTASLSEHIKHVMAEAGLSTLVTSLTDMIAFLLGGRAALPAVQYFSSFAAYAYAVIYPTLLWTMVVTFFLACMVLVERQKRKQFDMTVAPANNAGLSKLSGRISASFARFMMRLPVRITILVATFALAGLAASRVRYVPGGLPLGDLASRNSVLERQQEIMFSTFGKMRGPRVYVCFDKPSESQFGLAVPYVQNQMLDATYALANTSFMSDLQSKGGETFDRNFVSGLIEYAAKRNRTDACDETLFGTSQTCDGVFVDSGNPVVPARQFVALAASFLKENLRLVSQVSLSGVAANGTITGEVELKAICLPTYADPVGENFDKRPELFKNVVDFEDVLRQRYIDKTGEDGLFLYGRRITIYEHDYRLQQAVKLNLILAGVGVFVIALLLLQSPTGAILSIVGIGTVDVALFGLMWIENIRLNVVSTSAIILSIGLAIDYQLHLLHTMLLHSGVSHGPERVIHAFSSPVPKAVLLGGLTTLLGIVPLAGSSSNIFYTFFQLISFTVAVGLWSGIIFVPCMVSFLPHSLLAQQQQLSSSPSDSDGKDGSSEQTSDASVEVQQAHHKGTQNGHARSNVENDAHSNA